MKHHYSRLLLSLTLAATIGAYVVSTAQDAGAIASAAQASPPAVAPAPTRIDPIAPTNTAKKIKKETVVRAKVASTNSAPTSVGVAASTPTPPVFAGDKADRLIYLIRIMVTGQMDERYKDAERLAAQAKANTEELVGLADYLEKLIHQAAPPPQAPPAPSK